ncbi:MAG TPA: tetratricopeptide repeat protein [Nocardioidaceae bacterium]|nr:tetratricopeptide repeat protein [Nocardioidaceae bacterium]
MDASAIPSGQAERSARLGSLLDGRRILLLLDNARTVEQIRPLLPGAATCFVLVTSRDALTGLGAREGAHRLNLDRLSMDEATRLMRDVLGDDLTADADATRRLIERCVQLPLALRIAADLVRTRPARGVAGLVDELADERGRLDLLDVDDSQIAVRAVFSWSYQQLSPDTVRVFRMCGLHPGYDFDAYALAALADLDLRRVRRSIDDLVRAHLLEETQAGRVRAHDLLRAYAWELAEDVEGDDERRRAEERLAELYLRAADRALELATPGVHRRTFSPSAQVDVDLPTLSDHDDAIQWLDLDHANLIAVAIQTDDDHAVRLSATLWQYLVVLGREHESAIRIHTRALDIALQRHDVVAEADAHRGLAVTLVDLGRFEEAMTHAEWALELFHSLQDQASESSILNTLAAISHVGGDLHGAVRQLEQALALQRELGRTTPPASTLNNLTYANWALGRYEQAAEYAEEALRQAEAGQSRTTLAHSLCGHAMVAERTGDLDTASRFARRLLTLTQEGGVRALEPSALEVMGTIHWHRADYSQALRCHRRQFEVARSAGNGDEMAQALNGIGRTLRCRGDKERAVDEHQRALAIAREGRSASRRPARTPASATRTLTWGGTTWRARTGRVPWRSTATSTSPRPERSRRSCPPIRRRLALPVEVVVDLDLVRPASGSARRSRRLRDGSPQSCYVVRLANVAADVWVPGATSVKPPSWTEATSRPARSS